MSKEKLSSLRQQYADTEAALGETNMQIEDTAAPLARDIEDLKELKKIHEGEQPGSPNPFATDEEVLRKEVEEATKEFLPLQQALSRKLEQLFNRSWNEAHEEESKREDAKAVIAAIPSLEKALATAMQHRELLTDFSDVPEARAYARVAEQAERSAEDVLEEARAPRGPKIDFEHIHDIQAELDEINHLLSEKISKLSSAAPRNKEE